MRFNTHFLQNCSYAYRNVQFGHLAVSNNGGHSKVYHDLGNGTTIGSIVMNVKGFILLCNMLFIMIVNIDINRVHVGGPIMSHKHFLEFLRVIFLSSAVVVYITCVF